MREWHAPIHRLGHENDRIVGAEFIVLKVYRHEWRAKTASCLVVIGAASCLFEGGYGFGNQYGWMRGIAWVGRGRWVAINPANEAEVRIITGMDIDRQTFVPEVSVGRLSLRVSTMLDVGLWVIARLFAVIFGQAIGNALRSFPKYSEDFLVRICLIWRGGRMHFLAQRRILLGYFVIIEVDCIGFLRTVAPVITVAGVVVCSISTW